MTSNKVPFSSNSIRLSVGQWVIVGIICIVSLFLSPALWERIEKFSPGQNFRIPYDLSNDYWLYKRYCKFVGSQSRILVIGDSVIWGHFVPRDKTLSNYLNETTGSEQFVNLGLDGVHPAAMEGLLRYYGKDITNKNIILHFNPLWMSSPKQDLQGEKEFVFNHPKLVAQFIPKIPCYKASFSTRISAVFRRHVVLPNLLSHIKITYFQNSDIPAWTMENPYKNPLKALTFNIPDADLYEKKESTSHRQNNAARNGFQWVATETSFQWSRFRETVQLLQKRGSRVFVLVGPFNEHMLEGVNLESYRYLKKDIESQLLDNDIDYYAPPALPAELYIDASHPTSEGYALLAQQLCENEAFESFVLKSKTD